MAEKIIAIQQTHKKTAQKGQLITGSYYYIAIIEKKMDEQKQKRLAHDV